MVDMDPALTFMVDDVAADQALRLPCACHIRTFQHRALIALIERDARLHLIGLCCEFWCSDCGELPLVGWVVSEDGVKA